MAATAQTLELTITNIRNTKGNLVLGVFKDQASFDQETPFKNVIFPKGSNVVNGVLKATVSIEPGTYGVALLDDENADNKMNYTWNGMPKEGFGFSNYYHKGWSKPKVSSFLLTVIPGMATPTEIKIRYIKR